MAVLKGGRLERFYCSVFLGRLLSYKKFFSTKKLSYKKVQMNAKRKKKCEMDF